MKSIKSRFFKTKPVPIVHGNMSRRPKHQLSVHQVNLKMSLSMFLTTLVRSSIVTDCTCTINHTLHACVTEVNAVVLPGRVPAYKSSDIQQHYTKRQVCELYQQAVSVQSMNPVSNSTFTSLWWQLLPHVIVMKPMSDLGWMCQKNSAAITRSATQPEGEKTLVCKN